MARKNADNSSKRLRRGHTSNRFESSYSDPAGLVGCAVFASLGLARVASTRPKQTDDEEIVETLNHRYHRNLRFFEDWNNEDVLQTYLTALAHVYDPHSDYLGRAQLEQFAIMMNLSLFVIQVSTPGNHG